MVVAWLLLLLCSQEGLALSPVASRRRWLAGAGAAAAASAVPSLASAAPSFVSSVQGPVQDAVAPAHWIGQFVGINSKTESWAFADSSPAEVSAALVAVLNELTPERRAKLLIPELRVAQADASKVHVLTWTKAEWMDSLDVRLERAAGGRGCVATASFYATGLLPTSIPLAPLLNAAMAWSKRRHWQCPSSPSNSLVAHSLAPPLGRCHPAFRPCRWRWLGSPLDRRAREERCCRTSACAP